MDAVDDSFVQEIEATVVAEGASRRCLVMRVTGVTDEEDRFQRALEASRNQTEAAVAPANTSTGLTS